MMAQHFGAKDYRELSRSVGASVTLCLVFTVLLGVGGQLWAEPLLRLLNTPQDVLPGALLYLRIVYGGIPGHYGLQLPGGPFCGPWGTPKRPCTPLWWQP